MQCFRDFNQIIFYYRFSKPKELIVVAKGVWTYHCVQDSLGASVCVMWASILLQAFLMLEVHIYSFRSTAVSIFSFGSGPSLNFIALNLADMHLIQCSYPWFISERTEKHLYCHFFQWWQWGFGEILYIFVLMDLILENWTWGYC